MPKGSEELTAARKEEIIDACAKLYESMPFKDITIGIIGAGTSFTRTSIYNYFRTKEEIFLALLEREYAAWTRDMTGLAAAPVGEEQFPEAFAGLLEKRSRMLKLLAMNLYDMETGSRLENLVSFKRVYGASMSAVSEVLKAHYKHISATDVQQFIYAFFPFLFGVYPYTETTNKQKQAMDIAGVKYRELSITQIACSLVEKLTRGFTRNK